MQMSVAGNITELSLLDETTLRIRVGVFWASLTFTSDEGELVQVDGFPRNRLTALNSALREQLFSQTLRRELAKLQSEWLVIQDWVTAMQSVSSDALAHRRWITQEQQQAGIASKPQAHSPDFWSRLRDPEIAGQLCLDAATIAEFSRLWAQDWICAWSAQNEQHIQREMLDCKTLFDKVETQPLTPEQARAVICFDNRVQVVASAGSGKTSTMVAKAVYAVSRSFATAEQIVLLAFNRKAADELKQRAARSFAKLEMANVEVEATTFHALGLSIIGHATGRKPNVPDWAADATAGFRKLSQLVDGLKDRSVEFRHQWDLFRLVFARDLPPFGSSGSADGWDREGKGYMETLQGERVRSQEERTIADWLFVNCVTYEYERSYAIETATETHRQYYPDFYYPDVDLYHEHFALDEQGRAPPQFAGYLEGVAWKRQLHRDNGTNLIETTSSQLRNGSWMSALGQALTERGTVLDFNPDRLRPEGGRPPMEQSELVGLMRTFISHAKSNCLDIAALKTSLLDQPGQVDTHRHRMFLDLVGPVMQCWDAALAEEKGIDFEDMLNQAAIHLEQDRYASPYLIVMADEFQDASRARARLCRAMVRAPGRFLFAVGDDWQSINRFAGADVSVMTRFTEWFGGGEVLKLEQTFRCPQALCDVSSRFVSRNPAQIRKTVRSLTPAHGAVLEVLQADHRDKLHETLLLFLDRLAEGLRNGSTAPGSDGGKVSVMLLGRYNAERRYLPYNWQAQFGEVLELSFMTIHKSKGGEADYVVLPAMLSRQRANSFPNTRVDDPVLALAMPSGDDFPLGEERRLFYVALTRARRSVTLLTARGERSRFIDELQEEGDVAIVNADGQAITEESCPACKQGVIVSREGPYGTFTSCSNYPRCEFKPERRRTAWPVQGATVKIVPAIGLVPDTETQQWLAQIPFLNPGRAKAGRTGDAMRATSAKVKEPSSVQPPNLTVPAQKTTSFNVGRTIGDFFRSVDSGIKTINEHVERASALQAATQQLELALHAEKACVEAALETARLSINRQVWLNADPRRAAHFLQITTEIQKHRSLGIEPKQVFEHRVPPEFRRTVPHPNAETEEEIEGHFRMRKATRQQFFNGVYIQLAQDASLCSAFRKSLDAMQGSDLWSVIDPKGMLSKR